MKMKLVEFLDKHQLTGGDDQTVEYRLIDHPDYAEWKHSEHFPGFAGSFTIRKNKLTIIADADGERYTLPFDTVGEETCDHDEMNGFVFTNNDGERVKLVFVV